MDGWLDGRMGGWIRNSEQEKKYHLDLEIRLQIIVNMPLLQSQRCTQKNQLFTPVIISL